MRRVTLNHLSSTVLTAAISGTFLHQTAPSTLVHEEDCDVEQYIMKYKLGIHALSYITLVLFVSMIKHQSPCDSTKYLMTVHCCRSILSSCHTPVSGDPPMLFCFFEKHLTAANQSASVRSSILFSKVGSSCWSSSTSSRAIASPIKNNMLR